jgi:murein DD-endopeptidase MepM/ murein hydrolase activator NlpD
MRFADRLLTVIVTATLTSAIWIVVGSFYLLRPAETAAIAASPAPHPPATPTTDAPQVQEGTQPANLLIPVAGVAADKLSDSFNEMRGGHPHDAIDIMAPRGTNVLAAAPGTVEKLFRSVPGGNTIYVRSPDRTTIYYYAHLDHHYADGLKEGQEVARGQVISVVGSTGDASAEAPHLHFEIMRTTPQAKWYDPATDVDPYPLLTGKRRG